jgi:hypothetical protein
MALTINDDSMSIEVGGSMVTAAVRYDADLWKVTGWPRLLTRDEAIKALTRAEQLLVDRDDDSSITAWGGEPSHD